MTETTVEQVKVSQGFEITAWKWMRYSGLLLIPLAWIHVYLQDAIVGVHSIDLDYVAMPQFTGGGQALAIQPCTIAAAQIQ